MCECSCETCDHSRIGAFADLDNKSFRVWACAQFKRTIPNDTETEETCCRAWTAGEDLSKRACCECRHYDGASDTEPCIMGQGIFPQIGCFEPGISWQQLDAIDAKIVDCVVQAYTSEGVKPDELDKLVEERAALVSEREKADG